MVRNSWALRSGIERCVARETGLGDAGGRGVVPDAGGLFVAEGMVQVGEELAADVVGEVAVGARDGLGRVEGRRAGETAGEFGESGALGGGGGVRGGGAGGYGQERGR